MRQCEARQSASCFKTAWQDVDSCERDQFCGVFARGVGGTGPARAVVAYLELARRYNGSNNGTLHLSARELARAWNWSRGSAARAIEELVEKGFVEITRASGFNLKDHKRQATDTD